MAERDEPGAALLPLESRSKANPAAGHRARLRKRLLDGGIDALADHEVIEFVLMGAIPRKDVKPIARSLIQRFGSLAGVLNADARALALHPEMGETSAAALKIAALAARRMARSEVRQKPVLGSWEALLDYLAIDMAHLTVERVRVLYLDSRNRLVSDHLASEGTIDEAAIHPREVIRKGLDLGATALILVHNHPSGDPSPSRADIDLTRAVVEAGKKMGIAVHDHIIVGTNGFVSLRGQGLI